MTTDYRTQLNAHCQKTYGAGKFRVKYADQQVKDQPDNAQRWRSKCWITPFNYIVEYGDGFSSKDKAHEDAAYRMLLYLHSP
ncbi:hypothetical protein PIIN_10908 [Serendipita indica DSM 11827]|uniref:DRBM domain-containing protein n=1 Tax=Serendipita indica (strain DSM 11827) TaxID=1109443 RepID=G4U032_SERID|nr:hypothetical protein PIIN_10908 [Serendipita indica DSM 11827]